MRHCLSSLPNIKTIPYFNTSINCDCNCRLPEDCNNDDFLTLTSRLNNCFSPYPMRSIIKSSMCEERKNNNEGLYVCENVCDCPCHCITCICCPFVKEKGDINTAEYYKN